MVTEYGMSDVLGPQQLSQPVGEVFLGRDLGQRSNYSDEVAAAVDSEVRALIDQAHSRARAILATHRDTLEVLARELVERETLDTADLTAIIGHLPQWLTPAQPAGQAGPPSPARPVRARTRPIVEATPPSPGPARGRPLRPATTAARGLTARTAKAAPPVAPVPIPPVAAPAAALPGAKPARRAPKPEAAARSATTGRDRSGVADRSAAPKAAPSPPRRGRPAPRPGPSEQ
jgi:cell division protease FtsH